MNMDENKFVYIYKDNEGALFIPAKRIEESYKLSQSLEGIENWGQFRQRVKKPIYEYCFPSWDRHPSFIAIPDERKNDPAYNHFIDDNRYFNLPLVTYLRVLYINGEFGNDVLGWLPSSLKRILKHKLREVAFSNDIYILDDIDLLDKTCSQLIEYGFNYVCPERGRVTSIYNWENETKYAYKCNHLGPDYCLPEDLNSKYKSFGYRTSFEKKHLRLEDPQEFNNICGELEEKGFVIFEESFLPFLLGSFSASRIIHLERKAKWKEQASTASIDYEIEVLDIPLVYHGRSGYFDSTIEITPFTKLVRKEFSFFQKSIDPEVLEALEDYQSDRDLFNTFLTDFRSHGAFAIPFFDLKFRSYFTKQLIETPLSNQLIAKIRSVFSGRSWEKIKETIDERSRLPAPPSDKAFTLKESAEIITKYLAYYFIHKIISNNNDLSDYVEWIKEARSRKYCRFCGDKFKLIYLPTWLYCGSDGVQNCCFLCPIVEFPQKDAITQIIRDFIDLCGFIPNSDSSLRNYSFMSRINSQKKDDVILLYAKMGRPKHVKKLFGSWFKGLYAAGALPDDVLPTARGVKCVAKDGHVCRSLAEQVIDDWLSEHNIPHKREPYYPEHDSYNPSGRRRADWLVGSTFIEYFGLSGDTVYDKKTKMKQMLAQEMDIDLIPIYPDDISNLEFVLRQLLI